MKPIRLEHGLSQEELAFEADIHRTYVSDVGRGPRNIGIEELEKFAKALCITLGMLLDADD